VIVRARGLSKTFRGPDGRPVPVLHGVDVDVKAGEFDQFGPQNIAPLVAWLCSDDAAGVNGQVFRVGGRSVWPMKGWHSATRIKNPEGRWDPAKLGARVKEELAKGITAPEGMGDVFAGGL